MKTVKAKARPDEPITEAVVDKALARGRKLDRPGANATTVRYEDQCLSIGFADGSRVMLPAANYSEFKDFSPQDFQQLEVGFAGAALCCEARDLHVSITGLIAMSQPLMDMAVSLVASRNGKRSSTVKAEAARANGRKGGRPRKAEQPL
ncbi:DUF2442 domain-containing protein [Pseudomonas sp. CCM 7893]|uniref:DUF2442 domain-containing protein n=1 Tax=Pseudomonas spelaei TaxID=1055469 RepID=A0A6I3WH62_9PSED|nr:DUF2442 domain-containing protein [Pseudomonas spelaei]MUF06579.1 DUF2442 domain-containing protein [Pseudomonas spelaei]